ncbi:hypothetical protein BMS3Bbin14_01193 [bacterium BMS3Bbin14]|nr:hypothetical protein BMS3Abin13_01053 [bacterium BMS3Abin13]GBE52718.1 hypothetical protein BMS3Bbin14_01193 [bacterium BMS3Bbin14]
MDPRFNLCPSRNGLFGVAQNRFLISNKKPHFRTDTNLLTFHTIHETALLSDTQYYKYIFAMYQVLFFFQPVIWKNYVCPIAIFRSRSRISTS